MPYGRARRTAAYGEFWPGYVDVLSTLLLVVTFLLSVFMVAQFYVSQEVSGKDSALKRLTRQIAEITNLLSLEKGKGRESPSKTSLPPASLSRHAREPRTSAWDGLAGRGAPTRMRASPV